MFSLRHNLFIITGYLTLISHCQETIDIINYPEDEESLTVSSIDNRFFGLGNLGGLGGMNSIFPGFNQGGNVGNPWLNFPSNSQFYPGGLSQNNYPWNQGNGWSNPNQGGMQNPSFQNQGSPLNSNFNQQGSVNNVNQPGQYPNQGNFGQNPTDLNGNPINGNANQAGQGWQNSNIPSQQGQPSQSGFNQNFNQAQDLSNLGQNGINRPQQNNFNGGDQNQGVPNQPQWNYPNQGSDISNNMLPNQQSSNNFNNPQSQSFLNDQQQQPNGNQNNNGGMPNQYPPQGNSWNQGTPSGPNQNIPAINQQNNYPPTTGLPYLEEGNLGGTGSAGTGTLDDFFSSSSGNQNVGQGNNNNQGLLNQGQNQFGPTTVISTTKIAIVGKPVVVPTTTSADQIVFLESDDTASQTQCVQNCSTTSEYDPVCGSDNVSYFNPERLVCARNCGVAVYQLRKGNCVARSW